MKLYKYLIGLLSFEPSFWTRNTDSLVCAVQSEYSKPPFLNSDLSSYIEQTRQKYGVPGLAIAVVQKNSSSLGWNTYNAFYGIANARQDAVTDEVRLTQPLYSPSLLTFISLSDIVLYRVQFQAIHCCIGWVVDAQ
jgi:hypothetical protein